MLHQNKPMAEKDIILIILISQSNLHRARESMGRINEKRHVSTVTSTAYVVTLKCISFLTTPTVTVTISSRLSPTRATYSWDVRFDKSHPFIVLQACIQ